MPGARDLFVMLSVIKFMWYFDLVLQFTFPSLERERKVLVLTFPDVEKKILNSFLKHQTASVIQSST